MEAIYRTIIALAIVSLMSLDVQAFELGPVTADTWIIAYAPDSGSTFFGADNQIGSNTRAEASTTLSFKDYDGVLNIAYRADLDEDMSRQDLYDLKTSYMHPIMGKTLFGVVQYEETNDYGRYTQNARVGLGVHF